MATFGEPPASPRLDPMTVRRREEGMDRQDGPRFVRKDGSVNLSLFEHTSPLDLATQLHAATWTQTSDFLDTPRLISQVHRRIQIEQFPPDLPGRIVDKLSSVVAQASHETSNSRVQFLQSRIALSFLLASYVRVNDATVPPDVIRKIRGFAASDDPNLRRLEQDNIGKLIALDDRNARTNDRIGIREEVRKELVNDLQDTSSTDPMNWGLEQRLQAYTLTTGRQETLRLMNEFLETGNPLPAFFYKVFANTLDYHMMRNAMRDYTASHPDRKEEFDTLAKAIGIESGIQTVNVRDFYKKNTLKDHVAYSELQQKDISVLTSEFEGKKRVLDIGCGPGRLLIPLRKQGVPVEGVDEVEAYGAAIQKQDPDALFAAGSMDALPFKDKSFDGAYMLGRTFAHMKNISHGIKILQEARRALTDDGTLVLDMPDIESGEYAELTEKRALQLEGAGFWNFPRGSLHDTPNDINYFDRITPGAGQLKAMALLAGFDAFPMERQQYSAGKNNKATNVYWMLIPRAFKKLSIDEESDVATYLSPSDAREFDIETTGGSRVFGFAAVGLNIEDY